MVRLAVSFRPQAEAIARPCAIFALVALLVAGCGGSGDPSSSTTQGERPSTATAPAPAPERTTGETAAESRPSRRDSGLQRELTRHLRQESLGGAAGWRAADVEDVQARGTSIAIETRLRPARRGAAAALCLAARRYFLQGGQGQTAYDVVVSGRDGSTLAGC